MEPKESSAGRLGRSISTTTAESPKHYSLRISTISTEQMVSEDLSGSGHVLTPTDIIEEQPSLVPHRRSSSGTILSPDVQETRQDPAEGFYLLKKDSQRRLTLDKVLKGDGVNIVKQWHESLLKLKPDTCISQHQLKSLVEGFRGYISEQSPEPIKMALGKIKEDLDYDGEKINHVQLAIYQFQVGF